jgi:hypothetical protein
MKAHILYINLHSKHRSNFTRATCIYHSSSLNSSLLTVYSQPPSEWRTREGLKDACDSLRQRQIYCRRLSSHCQCQRDEGVGNKQLACMFTDTRINNWMRSQRLVSHQKALPCTTNILLPLCLLLQRARTEPTEIRSLKAATTPVPNHKVTKSSATSNSTKLIPSLYAGPTFQAT